MKKQAKTSNLGHFSKVVSIAVYPGTDPHGNKANYHVPTLHKLLLTLGQGLSLVAHLGMFLKFKWFGNNTHRKLINKKGNNLLRHQRCSSAVSHILDYCISGNQLIFSATDIHI